MKPPASLPAPTTGTPRSKQNEQSTAVEFHVAIPRGVLHATPLSSFGVLAHRHLAPAMLQRRTTRTVVEPKIPPFCATLDAHLTSINDGTYNTLAPADESKLDTERIQKAIDSCGKGKAVALQVHGASNAFLSGPLELREGVTLVVDKGATLFESLDPAVLEPRPEAAASSAPNPAAAASR